MEHRIRMLGLKPILCLLSLCYVGFVAAQERAGVPYPEELQLQQAIMDAALDLDPLDYVDPLQPIQVEKPEGVISSEQSELEKIATEALRPVTLEEEISDQGLSDDLEQYGYDLFRTAPSTFAPVAGIPVPADYLVGPGDQFILQIFSSADTRYELTVTREGSLLVPEIGDVQVAGLTFLETKTVITERIQSSRIGSKVVLTLAKLQSIQVMIVGEAEKPGTYTVSGLSSLLNTLVATGGVKRTGSLRSIQVRRNNSIVAVFDLYEVQMRGRAGANIFLRNGDIIFVPPIGPTVSIAGEVLRPAIYEIKSEETVAEVVELAGGLLHTADKSKTQLERVTNSGSYTLVQAALAGESAMTPIKSGDLIRVFPVVDKMERVVLLVGNVLSPGGYEWTEGMTVSDLVSRSALRQGTDLSIGLIERENTDLKKTEVLYFNPSDAIESKKSPLDTVLMPRDKVWIFDTSRPRAKVLSDVVNEIERETAWSSLPEVVTVLGSAKFAGKFPLQLGTRIRDFLRLSGGFNAGLDREYVLLVRTEPVTNHMEFIHLDLSTEVSGPDYNPVLLPSDKIYLFDKQSSRSNLLSTDLETLRSQTRYGEASPIVEISGAVTAPGLYPLTPGMRVKDLIKAAGGMREKAFGLRAQLARQKGLNGEFTEIEQYSISLRNSSEALDGLSTVLKPYDSLVLRQKPEWIGSPKKVTITGEVLYPGTYEVDKRQTLCGLVSQVGGFTEDAYLFGTVFARESVRKREQEAINRLHRQLDDLAAQVHLSPGVEKDTKLPVNKGALDTFRVIRSLKPEDALGRMVIDIEKAVSNCDEAFDVVLEDGDSIFVPPLLSEVSVVGEVYFPTSHQYRPDRGTYDYINLSGGTKELAQREHAYIVQANGEVLSMRSVASTWGWLLSPKNLKVTPGSTIYVPLSVDRINGREFAESWIDIVYKLTISAASVDFLFGR